MNQCRGLDGLFVNILDDDHDVPEEAEVEQLKLMMNPTLVFGGNKVSLLSKTLCQLWSDG